VTVPASPLPDPAAGKKKILLVEDDRFLRRACEATLRRRGFDVVTAADGEEGLRMARAEPPGLMLLDMRMPKLTGVEVLRALRASPDTRDVRVLILSNSSRQSDVDEAMQLGIVGYLVKVNLSLEDLGERVASLLVTD
jgi:CheY-like chemotaxis protein